QLVDRGFLPNFVFGPDDTIVTLGQDGLVANTLKYLDGQPVIGVNPDPARWDGKLLRFKVDDLKKIVPEVLAHHRPSKTVTKAKVGLNVKTEFAWDANHLFFTVREPFPTHTTGASLVFGRITNQTPLVLQSQTAENGVIFSDGIEKDFLEFNSGTEAVIGIAE